MATCPAGHATTATDYCDVCGIPVTAAPSPSPAPGATAADLAAGGQQACPSCDTPNAVDALFCEACGYDFTTGSMPRPLTPPDPPGTAPGTPSALTPAPPPESALPSPVGPAAPATPLAQTEVRGAAPSPGGSAWVAEVWVDPAWYAEQESPDPLPSAGLPSVVPLVGRSLLVGRTSRSRDIHPDLDCGSDSGVSRRQCQLTSDGTRWWVEDLGSANGTFVGRASGPLPEDPVPPGQKRELDADDRVYVGAWTRLVVRAATEDERAALG